MIFVQRKALIPCSVFTFRSFACIKFTYLHQFLNFYFFCEIVVHLLHIILFNILTVIYFITSSCYDL